MKGILINSIEDGDIPKDEVAMAKFDEKSDKNIIKFVEEKKLLEMLFR